RSSCLCRRTERGAKRRDGGLENSQWRVRDAGADDRTDGGILWRNGSVDTRHVVALHDFTDIDAKRHALEGSHRNQELGMPADGNFVGRLRQILSVSIGGTSKEGHD